MEFSSYKDGMLACLSGERKVDCAYIFYTADDSIKSILPDLSPSTIYSVCDSTHGVLRTKSIICESTENSTLYITITTRGGERLGINTPEFSAGCQVYNVAIATSGITSDKDILLVSTELTDKAAIPAGTDIVTTVTMEI